MTRPIYHAAGSALLAFVFAGMVHAQETTARGDGFDFTGLDVVTRIVEHTYPVSNAPAVSIMNRFGPVTVEAWDDAVVHLTVTIRVGAATEDQAVAIAKTIDVLSDHDTDRLDVRTQFPPSEKQRQGGFAIAYRAQVPRDALVTVQNTFGDTSITGVRGATTVDSRYGVIELTDLAGPVRVRARGEFPLSARNLASGGSFQLRGAQAAFREIDGLLRVSNYLGSITLHPGRLSEADIISESGPIHVYLPEGTAPHLRARADFGRIESEVDLERDVWARSAFGVYGSPEADQQLDLHAAFENVYIHRPASPAPAVDSARRAQRVQDEITQSAALGSDQTLRIDAVPGTVSVEGTDGDSVRVAARRHARVTDVANARLALEGLSLRVQNEGSILRVMTLVREDMEALGVTEHGVDLTVQCPEDATVEVYTASGETRLTGLSGPVRVEHGTGRVTAMNLSGIAAIAIAQGSASVVDSTGGVTVSAAGGDVDVKRVSGDISINAAHGRTVVDAPGAGLTIRARGGDVRIIALEGVQGDYDVRAEDGDISLAVPETASATFFLSTSEGTVRSAFPVTGTMEEEHHRFQGRLNDGKYRVVLETLRGNIRVD